MSGPVVSLTYEGNESDLVSSTDRAGDAFERLGDDAEDMSRRAESSGDAFGTMEEGADTAETRFTGFSDVLGGTADAFSALSDESLSTGEKLQALGQAGADLAGGFADFLIPAVKSMWTTMIGSTAATTALTAAKTVWAATTGIVTGAMTALNTVIKANPILFIVGLVFVLVAAFATLWQNSEGFRNFFIGMWNGIKNTVGGVIDFIKSVWNGLPGFFQGIVDTIGSIFSGIGNAISGAFKGAINFIINGLNVLISGINLLIRGINAVSPFDDIPSIPKIKQLQSGGRALKDGFAFIHEGETVRSASESAKGDGGGTLRVKGDSASWLYQMIEYGIRTGKITWDN